MPVTHEEGDRYPLRPPSYGEAGVNGVPAGKHLLSTIFCCCSESVSDKHLVEIATTFADVAQRKSIRLISERPTFRNCPSVPVLGFIQQI